MSSNIEIAYQYALHNPDQIGFLSNGHLFPVEGLMGRSQIDAVESYKRSGQTVRAYLGGEVRFPHQISLEEEVRLLLTAEDDRAGQSTRFLGWVIGASRFPYTLRTEDQTFSSP